MRGLWYIQIFQISRRWTFDCVTVLDRCVRRSRQFRELPRPAYRSFDCFGLVLIELMDLRRIITFAYDALKKRHRRRQRFGIKRGLANSPSTLTSFGASDSIALK